MVRQVAQAQTTWLSNVEKFDDGTKNALNFALGLKNIIEI